MRGDVSQVYCNEPARPSECGGGWSSLATMAHPENPTWGVAIKMVAAVDWPPKWPK